MKNCIKKGDTIKLVSPGEVTEPISLLYTALKRLPEIVSKSHPQTTEEFLDAMESGFKYGTVEVRLSTKEELASHTIQIPRSEEVNLLPIYKGREAFVLE